MKPSCTTCGQPHPKCNAHVRNGPRKGQPCMRTPIPGGNVCKMPGHGGNAPQVRAKAERRLLAEAARADLARMGVALEVTPLEALEAMLFEAAGNVGFLRDLAAKLPAPLAAETGPGGARKIVHHPLVTLYNEERDRLAKLSEACVKLGLDARRVKLAEMQADRLTSGVRGAAAEVGMTETQIEAFLHALAKWLRP